MPAFHRMTDMRSDPLHECPDDIPHHFSPHDSPHDIPHDSPHPTLVCTRVLLGR
jgi:hypothetical protein